MEIFTVSYTIDRINALLKAYGGTPMSIESLWRGRGHANVDILDRQAGIKTRFLDCPHEYTYGMCTCRDQRQLGARLALHEAHLKNGGKEERRYYHHLGADG